MRFAVIDFGLRDVVDEVVALYPEADVFDSLNDVNLEDYDFVILTSELGGINGDRLISAIDEIAHENVVVFCTTSRSLNGILRSRTQAFEIVSKLSNFDGAIISGFVDFKNKVEVLRMIIEDKITSR